MKQIPSINQFKDHCLWIDRSINLSISLLLSLLISHISVIIAAPLIYTVSSDVAGLSWGLSPQRHTFLCITLDSSVTEFHQLSIEFQFCGTTEDVEFCFWTNLTAASLLTTTFSQFLWWEKNNMQRRTFRLSNVHRGQCLTIIMCSELHIFNTGNTVTLKLPVLQFFWQHIIIIIIINEIISRAWQQPWFLCRMSSHAKPPFQISGEYNCDTCKALNAIEMYKIAESLVSLSNILEHSQYRYRSFLKKRKMLLVLEE